MRRLLSIDGGGVRGLLPARILAHLETLTGRPVHALFDAVCGTSAGAIVAAALTRPEAAHGDAAAFAERFRIWTPSIFAETFADRVGAVPRFLCRLLDLPQGFDANDLWRPRYEPVGRRTALEGFFGEARLTDARLPLLLVSYDVAMRAPVFFVSRSDDELDDTFVDATAAATLVDAVMASSAAPTYFPPHQVRKISGGLYTLVDGAVLANNPSQLGHAFFDGDPDDLVLSLGTGSLQQPYSFAETSRWGLVRWAAPLLKTTIDGQSEAAHIAMRSTLAPDNYLRIQPLLEGSGVSDELDDCRPSNLEALEHLCTRVISEHGNALSLFGEKLLR